MFGSKKTAEEIEVMEQQNAELQAKIKELENFLKEAPEKIQREELDRLQTMPPPDDLAQRRRENDFSRRLTKGELKNERRHQARNGMLFILLLAAIVGVCLWVYRIIFSAI